MVWIELPEDVLAQILSKLHPLDVVRAKLVCRSWRHASLNLATPPCALGFAIESSSSSQTLLYADPFCPRWLPLPLLSQPASFHATANSLLCLSSSALFKPYFTQFHIWNPLTRSHFCVPLALRRPAPLLVALCPNLNPNPCNSSFKIIIAGHKVDAERSKIFDVDLDLAVQVYDSKFNSWRMAGMVHGAAAEYSDPVCTGGRIYWLTRRHLRKHVLVYRDEDESWSILGASSQLWWPQDCCPYTLWAWEGNLFMAGEVSNAVTIWKLTADESLWLVFTHIAPRVVNIERFCGEKDVAGHGPLLCVMLVWARKGLIYDLRTHTVSWLPYCPVSSYNWGNVLPYRLGFASTSQGNGGHAGVYLDNK